MRTASKGACLSFRSSRIAFDSLPSLKRRSYCPVTPEEGSRRLSLLEGYPVLVLDGFAPILRSEHDVILAHSLCVRQALHLVCQNERLSKADTT